MKNESSCKATSYLPISWDDMEIINEAIQNKKEGKIFFFGSNGQLEEAKGPVVKILEEKKKGVYAVVNSGEHIRVDRIITIFGTVGAAYDEYEAFGNACMDCR